MLNFNAKEIYNYLVYINYKRPTCESIWVECFPLMDCSELWSKIYKMSFKTIRLTNIQTLNIKLFITPSVVVKKLFGWKISSSPKCIYCESATDDIIHPFYCVRRPKIYGKVS